MNKIEGYVHHIGELEFFGTNGFAKRTLVIVDDPTSRYPNYAVFDATRTQRADHTKDIGSLRRGDKVEVGFTLSAREWKDPKTGKTRWFGSATVSSVKVFAIAEAEESSPDELDETPETDADVDSLPF